MRKFTKIILGLSAAVAISSATATPVQNIDQAKAVIKFRQSVFTLLASNMGPLGAMAKGAIPVNGELVEKYATRLEQLSLMMPDYTRLDTSAFDIKTDALPKVWTETASFAEKTEALQVAAAQLKAVAHSVDESAIKKAIGGVGRTCKGCHDTFKAE